MHAARHKPRPAWREPAWEPQRIDFDYAYAVSAAGHTVYYASSSDHALHALDLRTGRLVWKYRPDVPDSRLIGNEQMISRWPARSGVLVEGDRVYTTFGMLSPEGGSSCQCAYNYKDLARPDVRPAPLPLRHRRLGAAKAITLKLVPRDPNGPPPIVSGMAIVAGRPE